MIIVMQSNKSHSIQYAFKRHEDAAVTVMMIDDGNDEDDEEEEARHLLD